MLGYENRKINTMRLSAIREHAGPEILDLGCGNGAYVLELKDSYKIRGLDWVQFSAWGEAPELFDVVDANNLKNIPSNSVDTVVCFEVLEHIENPDYLINELRRITRGNVIISVPDCELHPHFSQTGLAYSHWTDPTHVNFFDSASLSRLLVSSGLKVSSLKKINYVNVGLLVSRMFNASGVFERMIVKVLQLMTKNRYPMTLLVVADK